MKIAIKPPLGLNEIGQRQNNEDSIFPPINEKISFGKIKLFLVCDGVGGLAKGEIASALAC